ncbi:MAG: diguanylate cyclase [Deltaproteobacteria bacterium]|nr:diguanylate cyclase [Deltaproteobacteria bacterium]
MADLRVETSRPLGVLVVEDDREIRDMVTLMVKSMGYTVVTAVNGKDALIQLRRQPVDIVLLDLMMPEMDGFEFCQQVRAIPTLHDLHIIITSARNALEDKVRGLELGAADYLTKPFSLAELQARIKVGERIVRYQKTLQAQRTQLEHLAREDALTGLANRRRFEERAREELLREGRYQHPLSVLLADLDHFKEINDTYGHSYGDSVLKEVAHTFTRHCRSSDLCARYGGEEFAVLLPETPLPDARLVADRLCTAIRGLTFAQATTTVHVTVSLGIACFDANNPQSLEEFMEQADQALYAAKRNGRNRVEVYTRPGRSSVPPSSTTT